MSRSSATAPGPATLDSAGRPHGPPPGPVSLREAPVVVSAAQGAFDCGERFAGYVAHELRTPLATQRVLLELALADPTADVASWRETAKDVLRANGQQERLLEACLPLARSRRGLSRREPVDLAATSAEVLGAHNLRGLASVIVLVPAWTTGDPDLLERLVANLVSNATRHNIPGGRFELATRAESGRAVLSVANTGRLIPTATLGRLFQPFERLNSHPKSSDDGAGLGLAIVQAIADAHDAAVTARARRGGGLTIDIAFPAAAHTGPARRPADDAMFSTPRGSPSAF